MEIRPCNICLLYTPMHRWRYRKNATFVSEVNWEIYEDSCFEGIGIEYLWERNTELIVAHVEWIHQFKTRKSGTKIRIIPPHRLPFHGRNFFIDNQPLIINWRKLGF